MKVQPPCQTSSVGGCGCVYVCVREGWGGEREGETKREEGRGGRDRIYRLCTTYSSEAI